MSETLSAIEKVVRRRKLPYRGRGGQVIIYVGKMLRMFIYESDWKVLPMAALIAGIVAMVVHRDFFITMEGTLKGALALTCLSIWNGCFNSIQVVCREREIIKREHRAGLHISAYIFSHMFYQALLCLLQTGITIYVSRAVGVQYPAKGLFTPWFLMDIGITIFLMTYASDMLSLWVSCLTRSTTTAMTVMPFVLIFQLVFSGGMFSLPAWSNHLSALSISNYGLKCINAQANYNDLPLVAGWNSILKVENRDISVTVTLGQVLDFLSDDNIEMVHQLRESLYQPPSAEQVLQVLGVSETDTAVILSLLSMASEQAEGQVPDGVVEENPKPMKFGEIIDFVSEVFVTPEDRERSYTLNTTIGELIDLAGRDRVRELVETQTAKGNYNPDYENSRRNIFNYWFRISLFVVGFALLSVISLEFVDKDKR